MQTNRKGLVVRPLSLPTIVFISAQLLVFAMRFVYAAKYGLRTRLDQPLHYFRVREALTNTYVWLSLACVVVMWMDGRYFVGLSLVVCQFVISHILGFFNYRRAVIGIAEWRDSEGNYLIPGDIAEREKRAMSIVNSEEENGERG